MEDRQKDRQIIHEKIKCMQILGNLDCSLAVPIFSGLNLNRNLRVCANLWRSSMASMNLLPPLHADAVKCDESCSAPRQQPSYGDVHCQQAPTSPRVTCTYCSSRYTSCTLWGARWRSDRPAWLDELCVDTTSYTSTPEVRFPPQYLHRL